ncbi:hypothetical protein ACI7YT_12770 [Microbacterium sp. M]|uniref:hypothetical protein n=1 Tax=Microbacterium sp. M TaxID=3377125 RepID=UPI00386F9ED7
MTNVGIAPPQPATPVGQLRLLVGDKNFTALEPPMTGLGNYAIWSDDALAVTLATAGGSQYRAAWSLYLGLAAEYAQRGKSIRTDDLAIDTKGRGDTLVKVAESFLSEAESAEAAEASDFFQLVPFGGRPGRRGQRIRPEATPWPTVPTANPSPSLGSLDGGTP